MSHNRTIVIALLMIVSHGTVFAQDQPAGKVHGYVFGDYFYKFGGDSSGSTSQYSSHRKADQAFQLRRLYLFYDHHLSDTFAAQFLLEGSDNTFEPRGRHSVFIKTAFLEWKDAIPLGSLAFGLVPTPTWVWGLSERIWNYRSVEKTIVDFRGLGAGSDIGVALRGKFDQDGTFGYVAMIGNGNAQKPENNKYKKYYLSLNAKPAENVVVEGYVDYEPAALEKNSTTLKGFAAYQTKSVTIGLEVFQQIQSKAGTAGADRVRAGLTLFTWATLTDVLNAFGRYDFFNPDTKVSNFGYNEHFILVGLDYMPIPNVHIMPNLWINSFSTKGTSLSRDADVVGRVTFFYVYK